MANFIGIVGDYQTQRSLTGVTLSPLKPAFDPIILEPEEEGHVRVLAEFVAVLRAPQLLTTATFAGTPANDGGGSGRMVRTNGGP